MLRCMFLDLPVCTAQIVVVARGIQADREAKAQAERARLRTKNGSLFFRQFFSYLKLWLSFPVIPIFLQPFSMWIASGCGLMILQMPHFRSTWTGGSKESAGRKACRRGDTDFFPSSFEWTKYERLGLKTHISQQRHDVFVYRLQYRWDCRKHAAGRRMSSADAKMSNADVKRRRQSSMFCTASTELEALEACSNSKKIRKSAGPGSFWKPSPSMFELGCKFGGTKGWLAQRRQTRGSSQRERYIARMQIATLSTHGPPPSVHQYEHVRYGFRITDHDFCQSSNRRKSS